MHREQVTKQFLIEITKEHPNLALSIFIQGNSFSSVEPDKFLDSLYEAIDKQPEGTFIYEVATKILEVIKCDINQLPKYLNYPHTKSIVKWRLKNGI